MTTQADGVQQRLAPAGSTVALAGASGDLGFRIARALVDRGADVRALVRTNISAAERDRLAAIGLTIAEVDPHDRNAIAAAAGGAKCVISALNGLRDVIIERQGILLDAAVQARVSRFISSDFAADFTKTPPGRNRNFDLRLEFMARAESAPIRVTSILNGAFLDMLGEEMPIIQPRLRRVLYWQDADQRLDFTTKNDVAAYTAAAALDETTPRILRIAGDSVSARDLVDLMSEISGEQYRLLWVGSLGSLSVMIRIAKLVAPQPTAAFPAWQGMQYMRDQFGGDVKLAPLDNDRYPMRWTTTREHLKRRFGSPMSDGSVYEVRTPRNSD